MRQFDVFAYPFGEGARPLWRIKADWFERTGSGYSFYRGSHWSKKLVAHFYDTCMTVIEVQS